MTANYIKGQMEPDNEVFKVRMLEDITENQFKMACVAAMTEKTEIRCFAGIPTSDEFVLWAGKKKGLVQVRSWCGMLSLLIVSEGGTWLESSHIEGPDPEEVLEEAWKHFQRARPFIMKTFEHAFKKAELELDKDNLKWLDVTREFYYQIREYLKEINGDEDGSGKEL